MEYAPPKPDPELIRQLSNGGWETIESRTQIHWDEEPDEDRDLGCDAVVPPSVSPSCWTCTRTNNHIGWHVAGIAHGVAVAAWPRKEG